MDVVLIAAFVAVFGLISKRVEGTPVTAPLLAVAFGIVMGPAAFDALHFDVAGHSIRTLAEFTLALVLFHDAAGIDLSFLRRNLGFPKRLLSVGLLGTVLLGGLAAWWLLGGEGGLGVWEVALVGAILAPTDAALGQAVVSNESVSAEVRQTLNVESGLNDGLAVPIVAVLMACAAGAGAESGGGGTGTWVIHALQAIGYGAGSGVVVAALGALTFNLATRQDWMEEGAARVVLAAIPIIAFFLAESLHGSGFLAAFVAGLVVGGTVRKAAHDKYELVEDAGSVFGQLTWIAFGVAAVPFATRCASVPVVAYALLSLTVIRMVPVALALIGTGQDRATRLFVGWFGPRGLATVVFALAILHRGDIDGAERIFGVAVWTVLLSVVLHGVTAAPFARTYAARGRRE